MSNHYGLATPSRPYVLSYVLNSAYEGHLKDSSAHSIHSFRTKALMRVVFNDREYTEYSNIGEF